MSEEELEIIENKELTEQEKIFYADLFVKNCNEIFNKIENDGCLSISVYKSDIQAIQGLLDLYNKEKMNSSNLSEQLNKEKEKNKKVIEYINKNCSTNNCDFMDDGVGNLFKDILELLEERN